MGLCGAVAFEGCAPSVTSWATRPMQKRCVWVANRDQDRKTMSQDPQGRSAGSPEWEAMGWIDSSQDLDTTGQSRRERRMKQSQRQRGKSRFIGSTISFVWGRSLNSLGSNYRPGQVWRMGGEGLVIFERKPWLDKNVSSPPIVCA